jgi:hypothetical protein
MKLRLAGTANPLTRRTISLERRTSNVQHRTLNIDDAALYRFYSKRTAEYRMTSDEGWNRFAQSF